MATEAKRGCGYRKVGGLYLVAKGLGTPCDRLPLPLHVCPTCGNGIKQIRGFQWIEAALLSAQPKVCKGRSDGSCLTCPVCSPNETLTAPAGKAGLLWIGEAHYATPTDWEQEANRLGVSRRISALPDGLVFGQTWVMVAHPKAIKSTCGAAFAKDGVARNCRQDFPDRDCKTCGGTGVKAEPGIFHAFKPQACELIVTPKLRKAAWVKKLVKDKGVQLVEVPEDDPDHAPVVRQSARRKAMVTASRKAKRDPQMALPGMEEE
jgi:hypothetical protein